MAAMGRPPAARRRHRRARRAPAAPAQTPRTLAINQSPGEITTRGPAPHQDDGPVPRRGQLPLARLGGARPLLQPRQQRRDVHRRLPPTPLPNQVPPSRPRHARRGGHRRIDSLWEPKPRAITAVTGRKLFRARCVKFHGWSSVTAVGRVVPGEAAIRGGSDEQDKAQGEAKEQSRQSSTAPERATAGEIEPGSPRKMKRKEYEREMRVLQGELVAMQEWVKATGARVCIVFEGVDSAGKGGTIRRITGGRAAGVQARRAARPGRSGEVADVRPAVYRPLPVGWRGRDLRPQLVQPCRRRACPGLLRSGADGALPDDGALGRADDGRRRDHPDQVLPQRQPRGADPAAREPDRRPA